MSVSAARLPQRAVFCALFLAAAFLTASAAAAQTSRPADTEAAPPSAIEPRDVLINAFVPGYAQIKMGRVREGSLYLASLPLQIAGTVLQTLYLADVFADEALERFWTDADGRWYVYYSPGLAARPGKWQFYAGTILSLYGALLASHSQYDLLWRLGLLSPEGSAPGGAGAAASRPSANGEAGPISLGQAMAAPWLPGNLFNRDILPVFGLSLLPDLSRISGSDLAAYFERDRVPFLGRDVSPLAGLVLAAGSGVAIAQANAVWEEIVYRGITLQSNGVVGSSLRFGLVHIPNALVPNTSIQETLWQSVFATMFGLYAGSVTERDGGDFRKAIAWHFWNNVVAFTLGYLTSPDEQMLFSVGVDLRW